MSDIQKMLRTSSWPADWLTDRASGWLSLVVGSLVSWAIVPIIILPLAGDKKVLFTLFHLLHSGPYKSMSATKHSLWKRISNGKFDFFFFLSLFPPHKPENLKGTNNHAKQPWRWFSRKPMWGWRFGAEGTHMSSATCDSSQKLYKKKRNW